MYQFLRKLTASNWRIRKLLLIMRLTSIILLALGLHASAGVGAQKVTITGKKMSLKEVFSILHRQAHYDFIYTDDQLRNSRAVDLDDREVEVLEVLKQVFFSQPLTYSIEDRTVVVRDREKAAVFFLSPLEPVAVEGPVAGIVVNQRGATLSGATVVIKRTHAGVTTDLNGFFQLKLVEPNDTLIVSYIGYKTLKVAVAGARLMNVKLEESHDELDEMVVQAYGHTTQRLTTGSIGRVTAAEIGKQPVGDVLLALEARVPGVQVTQESGFEGAVVKVEIRGRNSLNPGFTTQPLYIVDGVPITVLDVYGTYANVDNSTTNLSRGIDQTGLSYSGGQSPLYNINPQDIQSIEILKDADATAIYGSRGANGVVLITTKRGKPGMNSFDVTASEGLNFMTRKWPFLHTRDYLQMRREQFRNDGVAATAANAPDLLVWDTTRYTDWLGYAFGRSGKNTNVQSSLSGGTDLLYYRISAGFNRTTDITATSGGVTRFTASSSITSLSPNKRLQTALSLNYGSTGTDQIQTGVMANLPPDAPAAFTKSGALNYIVWDQAKSSVNFPFASLLQPYNSRANTLNANLSVNYNIMKGLRAGVSLGYNNIQNIQQRFTPIRSQDPYSSTAPTGTAAFGNSRSNNWIFEPQATYTTLFKRAKIDLLAGGTIQHNTTDGLLVTGTKYTSDIFLHSISLAPSVMSVDNYGQYKYAGLFARATINWDNKYILNINARRDGSSRFGPGNQFGNFGSLGAAWILSDEASIRKFLPSEIDFLKIRGSYGTTGSDAIGDYQYLSQWGNTSPNLPTYDTVTPLLPQIQPNNNFHWQVNRKLEGALDIELLNQLLMIEVAYYRNRCNNQLVNYQTPEFTGFTTIVANRPANVQNQGWEMSVTGNLIRTKDLYLMVDFNIGINRDKLLAYPDIAVSPWKNQYRVGQSLNLSYAYHYLGVDPLTGKYAFEDHNHDGKVQSPGTDFPGTGADDRYVMLNRTPKYFGGFGSQVSYKGFMLSAHFSFSRELGLSMLAPGGATSSTGLVNWGQYTFDHRWKHVGQQDAKFAGPTTALEAVFGTSDAGYSDASFFRMQTLAFSYSLPMGKLKKTFIKGVTFNINTHDLFVLTTFKGMDPQLKAIASGHPMTRTITSGLNLSF